MKSKKILTVLFLALFAFMKVAAKETRELPVYNPSFEDWNDSYPLFGRYTTTVPTGWNLGRTGYAPCEATVKTSTRYKARTGDYAVFMDAGNYSNSIISDKYKLSEGTYTFSVYAANIGYGGTILNMEISGTVNKTAKYSVNGNNGIYSQYSISFNMETDGEVQFIINNEKEWDGNSTISHFAIDDWSLTSSDGNLLGIESSSVYSDANFTYYLYCNGESELVFVNNKNISDQVSIPETISSNNQTYIVRNISPYAFADCNSISSVIFPKRLYKIGNNAFQNCKNLKSVLFPTYLQTIGESAFIGCTNLDEAIFMTKTKPSLSKGVFESQTLLYVPKVSNYNEFGDRVKGLAFVNEEIKYQGIIPNINFITPSFVSLNTVDRSSLLANSGQYTLTAVFAANGMEVEGEIIVNILPVPLRIIGPNINRVYGEENPSIQLSYEGFVNGETKSVLTSNPLISLECNKTSDIGVYPIIISQASASNYEISYSNGSITVEKRPLNISIINEEITYGQDIPQFKLEYDGLASFETTPKWDNAPQFSTSAKKGSDVGQYSVSTICNPHNYNVIDLKTGTLTISKAHLIIKANNLERNYFEENPIYDYTVEGFTNNDTKTCITTPPTFSCSAILTSNAGQYSIIPSNANAKNYDIEYRDGILTINKRTITASIENYTRKYNTENPEFEISYSGFVNNENASILYNRVIATCNATKSSDVGIYPITLSGGEAVNYFISKYNNGTLTIEKADQVIIWDQDLSNIELYAQVELTAKSDAGLPITYEMSPNNVATLYSSDGKWYLDCYGNGSVNIRATQNGDKNHNAASIINNTLIVGEIGTDPNNPQIYFNVETPGTLPSLIADNRKNQIKNLRLTGNLNGTDINYLREMAGCDSNGNTTPGILETLDISECTIVSGGRSYFRSCQTSNCTVGDYMFYSCKTLINLMLPENSTSIGAYALADCDRLSSLSIPNSISSFGAFAFRNDISLLRISMPNNLTTIGDMAFYGCNGLTELNIPQSVNYLGEGIINSCENIAKINVENGNTHFTSKDGVLYTYSTDELLIYPMNYSATEYVVPEGVSKIAPYAFVNAKKLTDVVLPSSLTNVGTDAFIGCVNLNSLHVLALNPPTCQNDCFENVSKTRCELRVPEGCYNYYWVAPVWSEFNHIVEMEYNSIVDAISDEIEIISQNGVINIHNVPTGLSVYIYLANGTLIYHVISDGSPIQHQCVSKGTIIVVAGNKTYKLFLK